MGNLMNRLGGAVARFMYGRNGSDQLNMALLLGYVAILLVRTVVLLFFPYQWLATVFSLVIFALALVILFRIFSRNLEKRRRENQRFLQWWTPKRAAAAARRSRRLDREHRYFKCPGCGAICRVPRGKGRIQITCPRCRHQINAKS